MDTTHERLVWDVVDIFDRLDTEDSFGSERELAASDLKSLGREELVSEMEQAERFLATVWTLAAQMDNIAAMVAVADARRRAEAALERLKEAQ